MNDKEAQTATLELIDYGPLKLRDAVLEFRYIDRETIEIIECSFRLGRGNLSLVFKSPIDLAKQSLDFDLVFKNLDFIDLVKLIPDTTDQIYGKIEGRLPIKILGETINWGAGYAKLMPGETGKMIYSEDGWIQKYLPEMVISEELDLSIKDILREIELSKFEIQIQPSDAKTKDPYVVLISGKSLNPKIQVPIESLRMNINFSELPQVLNGILKRSEVLKQINWNNQNE